MNWTVLYKTGRVITESAPTWEAGRALQESIIFSKNPEWTALVRDRRHVTSAGKSW